MLPIVGDQGMNAPVFGEKLGGVEVPRDEENGAFTRDEVAETLKLVMVGEQGKIYREKVKEMSKIFGDKEQQKGHIDRFLEYLENH